MCPKKCSWLRSFKPVFWGVRPAWLSTTLRSATYNKAVACDGVFMEDMLSEEGNGFAQYYFDFERGQYLRDYGELLAKGLPTMYHVADSWANYERLKARIDKRYREWERVQSGGWRSWLAKLR